MNFHFKVGCDGGVIRVRCFGRLQFWDACTAAEQVAEKFRHRVPLRILLDFRYLTLAMSIAEQRQFAHFIAEHKLLAQSRVAMLQTSLFNPFALLVKGLRTRHFKLNQFVVEREALEWVSKVR